MSFFDTAYEGSPPWDLGRPQRAVVELAEAGRIVGSVLDVGCGTGEHALYLAERGHAVVGVDLSPRAIELATTKAWERGSPAVFEVWDALRVDELGRPFDTALDVGMFHTLTDEERPVYARSLRRALRDRGRLLLLCWSERNDWGRGPRRVSQMELLGTFEAGWTVLSIEPASYESRLPESIHAWLMTAQREELLTP